MHKILNATIKKFALLNVTCASCVATLEKALTRNFDKRDFKIDFMQKILIIKTAHTNFEIISIIKNAGFTAKLIEINEEEIKFSSVKIPRPLFYKGLIAFILGVCLFYIGAVDILPKFILSGGLYVWLIVAAVTLLGMIFCGSDIYKNSFRNIIHGRITMDTLVAISTIGAWIYSLAIIINPDIVPFSDKHIYFEAAIFIIAFVNIGRALEVKAQGTASSAIERLFNLASKTATVIRDNKEINIAINDVVVGDVIKVRPGEKIATDGVVIDGYANVDESMLTGEAMPVTKKIGDKVIGATINKNGVLFLKATEIGKNTVLSHIIEFVRSAQETKPLIAKIADIVVSYFVPIIVGVAILTALAWFTFGGAAKLNYIFLTSMSVLVIACPCALGLAVPISIVIGMGRAAEAGVLIRNGTALEKIGKADTIVFDKTGTITLGKPAVVAIKNFSSFTENEILTFAASLENNSEHPLAKAILAKAKEEEIILQTAENFQAIIGEGVSGKVAGKNILLGNSKLLEKHNVSINNMTATKHTNILLAIDNVLIAQIEISDPVRYDSKDIIQKLKALNLEIILLTGDHENVAREIARDVGIENVIANVMPNEKAQKIINLQKQNKKVIMVGDGINDAPALAQSDVGIAIGAATDIAIESADISLLQQSITGVLNVICISKVTMRNIKQNLFGAFIYNIICIPVAAGVLYPFFGILLSPAIAALAMALSDITVVGNALRLRLVLRKCFFTERM